MNSNKDNTLTSIIVSYEKSLRKKERGTKVTIHAIVKTREYMLSKGGLSAQGVLMSEREHWYTRLAAALSDYVARGESFNEGELAWLLSLKNEISGIFFASGYKHTAHLISICSNDPTGTKNSYTYDQFLSLLVFLSINDLDVKILEMADKLPAEIYNYLACGWLSEKIVLSKSGDFARNFLLKNITNREFNPKKDFLPIIGLSWANCSYATSPQRNLSKKFFNKGIQSYLKELYVPKKKTLINRTDKQTIVVILESFKSDHAIFRCYGPLIQSLSSKFRLVGIVSTNEIDNKSAEIFDEIIIDEFLNSDLSKVINKLESISPDVIFYPSVGLRLWTILLSNLRLAPIQIAGQGHPATTMSEEIDYVATWEGHDADYYKIYSEKIILLPENTLYRHPSAKDILQTSEIRHDGISIGINANIQKVNFKLLDICKRLICKYGEDLNFVFYPYQFGILDDGARAAVVTQLPSAKVHSPLSYVDYMQQLSNCELCLAPFPFGNTNCTIDAIELGIPIVAMFGEELPEQTDTMLIKDFAYSAARIAKSEDDYFESASALVGAVGNASKPRGNNKKSIFATESVNSGFAEMIEYIIENYLPLSSSSKAIIRFNKGRTQIMAIHESS